MHAQLETVRVVYPYPLFCTTRKKLTAGDLKMLTAGTFEFADGNLTGGKRLPPAFSNSPVVTGRYPRRFTYSHSHSPAVSVFANKKKHGDQRICSTRLCTSYKKVQT
jgi:hypothetical protein